MGAFSVVVMIIMTLFNFTMLSLLDILGLSLAFSCKCIVRK